MKTKQRSHTLTCRRKGAAAIEAALVLPLLFALLFSGWEFARINVIRNTIDNAAYTAAREAMLPGAAESDVQTAGQIVLDAVGISGGTITMTPNPITTQTSEVSVNITVPVASNSLGIAKLFTSGNLTADCTLSRELQPGTF